MIVSVCTLIFAYYPKCLHASYLLIINLLHDLGSRKGPSRLWASEACLFAFMGLGATGYPTCTSRSLACTAITLRGAVDCRLSCHIKIPQNFIGLPKDSWDRWRQYPRSQWGSPNDHWSRRPGQEVPHEDIKNRYLETKKNTHLGLYTRGNIGNTET